MVHGTTGRGWVPKKHLEKEGPATEARENAHPAAWVNSPFADRAMVLGIQAAGKGRLAKDLSDSTGPVHVITNLNSVAVRYVFMLPKTQFTGPSEDYGAPERATIEKPMMQALEKFQDTAAERRMVFNSRQERRERWLGAKLYGYLFPSRRKAANETVTNLDTKGDLETCKSSHVTRPESLIQAAIASDNTKLKNRGRITWRRVVLDPMLMP